MIPSQQQPGWPEDTLPFDRVRDVVGLESYSGWGPHRGPQFYPAETFDPDDFGAHRHKTGRYIHGCRACRASRARTVRGHDYEQLWYRSMYWFTTRQRERKAMASRPDDFIIDMEIVLKIQPNGEKQVFSAVMRDDQVEDAGAALGSRNWVVQSKFFTTFIPVGYFIVSIRRRES